MPAFVSPDRSDSDPRAGLERAARGESRIALVELLAYVGDQLSYYQDAVANEAYLETARQRISVKRHTRFD
jgi:hypothetical protein